ncbi:MAG: hypothetical protein K6G85_04525 [Eubacterium sp.]|nr:hypothetical protein [Eubacterium sp.]
MNKNKKAYVVLMINVIGIICLIYAGILFLSHSTTIANPKAMIPMESWERGGILLTIGLLPMIVANLLGALVVVEKSKLGRILFFVPSMIEFVLVACYWCS